MPRELEGWKWKVLLAGKYLNVIRECGIEVGEEEGGAAKAAKEGEAKEKEEEDLSMADERYSWFRFTKQVKRKTNDERVGSTLT